MFIQDSTQLFLQRVESISIPLAVGQNFHSSTSLPTFGIIRLPNFCQCDSHKISSYCIFILHFPDYLWDGGFSYMVIGYSCFLFWEMLFHVFCPFVYWVIVFFLLVCRSFYIFWTLIFSQLHVAYILLYGVYDAWRSLRLM